AFGCGLEGLLRRKASEGLLCGFVNGIDDSWDPANDPRLLQGVKPGQWEAKQLHARHVARTFDLHDDGPLFAVVSRLVHQKGIDLTRAPAVQMVAGRVRMTILGQGERTLEHQVEALTTRFPGRDGVNITLCEPEARRIIAGSDFLLMPSRYEPCGLS